MTDEALARSTSTTDLPLGRAAFLFDLDGSIADTKLAHGHAYKLAFAEIGHSISEFDFEPLSGLHFSEVIQRLSGGLSMEEASVLHRRKTQLFVEIAGDFVQPLPLLSVARSIRNLFPIALVTSATHRTASCVLRVIDADNLFPVVVAAEDVRNSKPDPEPYLSASSQLGISPANCVAFEDSRSGYLSATRAGMSVVQVSDIFENENLLGFLQ